MAKTNKTNENAKQTDSNKATNISELAQGSKKEEIITNKGAVNTKEVEKEGKDLTAIDQVNSNRNIKKTKEADKIDTSFKPEKKGFFSNMFNCCGGRAKKNNQENEKNKSEIGKKKQGMGNSMINENLVIEDSTIFKKSEIQKPEIQSPGNIKFSDYTIDEPQSAENRKSDYDKNIKRRRVRNEQKPIDLINPKNELDQQNLPEKNNQSNLKTKTSIEQASPKKNVQIETKTLQASIQIPNQQKENTAVINKPTQESNSQDPKRKTSKGQASPKKNDNVKITIPQAIDKTQNNRQEMEKTAVTKKPVQEDKSDTSSIDNILDKYAASNKKKYADSTNNILDFTEIVPEKSRLVKAENSPEKKIKKSLVIEKSSSIDITNIGHALLVESIKKEKQEIKRKLTLEANERNSLLKSSENLSLLKSNDKLVILKEDPQRKFSGNDNLKTKNIEVEQTDFSQLHDQARDSFQAFGNFEGLDIDENKDEIEIIEKNIKTRNMSINYGDIRELHGEGVDSPKKESSPKGNVSPKMRQTVVVDIMENERGSYYYQSDVTNDLSKSLNKQNSSEDTSNKTNTYKLQSQVQHRGATTTGAPEENYQSGYSFGRKTTQSPITENKVIQEASMLFTSIPGKSFAKKTALVIVDMTDDYCVRGNIGIPGTWDTIPIINNLTRSYNWDTIFKVREVLNQNDKRFADNYTGDENDLEPVFTILTKDRIFEDKNNNQYWTKHSIERTPGAAFDLLLKKNREKDIEIIKTGSPTEVSYSAFGTKNKPTNFLDILKAKNIEILVFVGAAFDYGVGDSAIDSIGQADIKETYILEEATKFIFEKRKEEVKLEYLKKGGYIISQSDIKNLVKNDN